MPVMLALPFGGQKAIYIYDFNERTHIEHSSHIAPKWSGLECERRRVHADKGYNVTDGVAWHHRAVVDVVSVSRYRYLLAFPTQARPCARSLSAGPSINC